MNTTRTVFAALLLAASSIPAVAQDQDKNDPDVKIEGGPKETEKIFRDFLEDEAHELSLNDLENRNIFELVDMIMMVRISKELDLDEAGCIEFYRRIGKFLDKVHRLKWERGSVQYALRYSAAHGESSKVIADKLERALDIDREIDDGVREMIHAASEYMSAEQAAKLYLFAGDFESEIKELIMRAETVANGGNPEQNAATDTHKSADEKKKN